MLVDLGRNDLGKISALAPVQVERLHTIERFSHVMHIGSTIRGEIPGGAGRPGCHRGGAPRGHPVRRPQDPGLPAHRGAGGQQAGHLRGAIGYIDFTGNMDTCIAIRIAYQKNGRVFVRSGAGIVADSVPEQEFEECMNKARASLRALELAQEAEL